MLHSGVAAVFEELDEEDAKGSVGAFRPKRAGTVKKENADENDEVEEVETKKMGGLLDGIERSNPNHEKKAERMLKVKDLDSTTPVVDPDAGMNRKERYVNEEFSISYESSLPRDTEYLIPR